VNYLARFTLPESGATLTLAIEGEEGQYLEIESDMTAFGKRVGLQLSYLETEESPQQILENLLSTQEKQP